MEEFQIVSPSGYLKYFIRHYWMLRTDSGVTAQRVIPSGCVNIVFHMGNGMHSLTGGVAQPCAFIGGQSIGYEDLCVKTAVDMVCIVFNPFGARALFDIPLSEFYGLNVAVSEYGDRGLADLHSGLFESPTISARVELLDKYFIGKLRMEGNYNFRRMNAAVSAVENGEINVGRLANLSCLSERQFSRVFNEYVGCPAKDFVRVLRFQKALYLMQTQPAMAMAQLSAECGFYDQPHMIREFRKFSGYSPSEYSRICPPYSDYFSC